MKKAYTSLIFLTLIYGLPFGLLMTFVNHNHSPQSLLINLASGLLFGIIMATFQRKRFQDQFKVSEDNKVTKNKIFDTYLKQTKVPESDKERAELMLYMDKIEKRRMAMNMRAYPKKYSKPLVYTVIVIFFFFTLSLEGLRYLAVIYPITIIIGLIGEYRARVIQKRIDIMRMKLNDRV